MIFVNAKLLRQFGKRVKEGTILFKEGEPGASMYVVHRGKVKISKLVDGQPTLLAVMTDGQFFGEMAILNRDARSATATAVMDTELLEIPSAGFELLMQKSPEIALQMVKAFSDRLKDTNKMLNVLFYQDDYSRVVMTVFNLCEVKVREGNQVIIISLDPNATAGQLNMTSARVIKVMDDLLKADVIQRNPGADGQYKVPHPKELLHFLRFIHETINNKKAS